MQQNSQMQISELLGMDSEALQYCSVRGTTCFESYQQIPRRFPKERHVLQAEL